MRTKITYTLKEQLKFKQQLLQWSKQFEEIAWLDSNNYHQDYGEFDALLAVGAFTAIKTDYHQAFAKLQEYQQTTKDWIFGYLSYDLKNDVERLSSKNHDGLDFPDLYFFQPQKLFLLKGDQLEMHYLNMLDDEIEEDFTEISNLPINQIETRQLETENSKSKIQARISKEEYLQKVGKMLAYIQRGDIYEANFCQEFFAENREIEPFKVFQDLNELSGPPFATFLKLEEHYLLSASPERYLKKSGVKLISQPIKGTARRSQNPEEDLEIAEELSNDPKEQSENVMIVDLVRNDLSKIAKKASVNVDELCKVYSFKQVHQMISTISAELDDGIPPVEALRATFPMGSMTGAPKISAMKIIEELEETKRGLYSGAVGYFTPNGDFDFNVVIRSILYNSAKKHVSFSVGGAITAGSKPEKEYEECLLKAAAMRQALK
ncbi:aminodeoxychorismate synthase component I [Salegentibacter salarius]|uniref:aminodeoxychorismate synthase n=1 Tax=Salegentibacter salarius TaxID=435906 RepID=A0A2N0U5M3_9FLAO|nr:aminodeoxychorismate synthase component I [Salegentibacter salarius]OEY74074.1 aminodeoxychorismate synthase, component I [Salegentibacter salarius]PKD22275.1 aminobenzoate synthetase [Salegentibacter salarius]SLJ86060.1 para-aminobenzoate synthetase component 1 [Salegentibacter salarius]